MMEFLGQALNWTAGLFFCSLLLVEVGFEEVFGKEHEDDGCCT